MFVLFIIFLSLLFLDIYKTYFKLNFYIIIGYLSINIIIFLISFVNLTNAIYLSIVVGLLYLSIITDIKEQWISDLTIIMVLIFNVVNMVILYVIYNKKIIYEGIIFIVIVICLILLIQIALKKELIGFGDLKLYFVLMVNQDIMFAIIMLLLSSILGIVYYLCLKKKTTYFPFGPSIIIAYIIIYILKTGLEYF